MTVSNADTNLSVGEALVREMMTASVDTGIDFHFMRFMKMVAITDRHDDLIAIIRVRLIHWPAKLPSHHKELAEELIVTIEAKKREAAKAARETDLALIRSGEADCS